MQRSDYLYQVEMGSLILLTKIGYVGLICESHDNRFIYSDESGFSFHTDLNEAIVKCQNYINDNNNDNIYAVVKTMNGDPVYSIGKTNEEIVDNFIGKRWSDEPARELTGLDYALLKAAAKKTQEKEADEFVL